MNSKFKSKLFIILLWSLIICSAAGVTATTAQLLHPDATTVCESPSDRDPEPNGLHEVYFSSAILSA